MTTQPAIRVVTDEASARALLADGWCPIECSFGRVSVLDELGLDHHGELSQLEGVAIRALRDHAGARAADPRFVIAGAADADATFAAAALAGLLPGPRGRGGEETLALAQTIDLVDREPVGLDIPTMPGGALLLAWRAFAGNSGDAPGALLGVLMWHKLARARTRATEAFLAFGAEAERQARREALEARARETTRVGRHVLLAEASTGGGQRFWYGRRDGLPAGSPDGWEAPVLVTRNPRSGAITAGCASPAVAEALLGLGGLMAVFPLLPRREGGEWGGREAIGGSPRGAIMTAHDARDAAVIIAAAIDLNLGGGG